MKPTKFIEQLFEQLGFEILSMEVVENESEMVFKLSVGEEEAGLVLGSRATGIDAIQRVLRVIFGQDHPDKKLYIDINEYRDKRSKKIIEMVRSIATVVQSSGEPSMINQYLSPSERFVVHKTMSEDPNYSSLESYSVGEGVGRRVVIQLKSKA
ncbi:MAG TPA: R3H domain-containing nucleic acid-binding protein, partial [Candidatus Woesebacteria bacterium]|nr:R3H domain-containing nucleic acid-binding protein [Candidatus Woesebacteria bacterium]